LRSSGKVKANGPAIGLELPEKVGHRAFQLAVGQVAEPAQPLGHLVDRTRRLPQTAQPAFDLVDRARIEQMALFVRSD